MRFLVRVVVNAFAIWVVTLIPALQVTVTPFAPGDTLQLVLTLLLVGYANDAPPPKPRLPLDQIVLKRS